MPQSAGPVGWDGRVPPPDAAGRSSVVVKLGTLEDPATDDGHWLEYEIGKDRPGGRPLHADVSLVQGYRDESEPGREIARFIHRDLPAGPERVRQELLPPQAAAIDDYTDLWLRADFTRGDA